MDPTTIAQLAVVLAPLMKDLIVEGNKIIVTYRDSISRSDLEQALELSKSANWPELTFGSVDATNRRNP